MDWWSDLGSRMRESPTSSAPAIAKEMT